MYVAKSLLGQLRALVCAVVIVTLGLRWDTLVSQQSKRKNGQLCTDSWKGQTSITAYLSSAKASHVATSTFKEVGTCNLTKCLKGDLEILGQQQKVRMPPTDVVLGIK